MAVIDVAGFVADLKDHAVDHGFHVHDERHFVETYSLRQAWEVDLHPEDACGGPLDLHLALEVDPRIDDEREVQVDRSLAAFLGVEVDLPRLAERVRLDEVALVVHVEPVLDRVVLQIGNESCNVDDGHRGRGYRTPPPADSLRPWLSSMLPGTWPS